MYTIYIYHTCKSRWLQDRADCQRHFVSFSRHTRSADKSSTWIATVAHELSVFITPLKWTLPLKLIGAKVKRFPADNSSINFPRWARRVIISHCEFDSHCCDECIVTSTLMCVCIWRIKYIHYMYTVDVIFKFVTWNNKTVFTTMKEEALPFTHKKLHCESSWQFSLKDIFLLFRTKNIVESHLIELT